MISALEADFFIGKDFLMNVVNQQEEWVDIVNENDEVVGSMPRSEAYDKKMFASMRASWLMIKNSEGKLWIPRRNFNKKVLPGALDGSVVGHVSAGESYEQALIREAWEEVGIDLKKHPYRFLGKLTPGKDSSFCFAAVYELEVDDVPDWNRDDFVEFFWLLPQEVVKKIISGDFVKDSLLDVLKSFY